MGIYIRDEAIVLENDYALLCVSQGDSCVQRIFDKVNGRELKGEDTCFFSLVAQDRQTVVAPTALHYSDGCITVETPLGDFRVAAAVRNGYFTFELMDALPAAAY